MKYILSLCILIICLSSGFSQRTTVRADAVRAGQTIQLDSVIINLIEQDTSLSSLSNAAVPTSLAVREFVLNWLLPRVDTFYSDGDNLYLIAEDTFIVDMAAYKGGVLDFFIDNDSLFLQTNTGDYGVDLIDYLQEEVTDFYESGDTLYLVVGATEYAVYLPVPAPLSGDSSFVAVWATDNTLTHKNWTITDTKINGPANNYPSLGNTGYTFVGLGSGRMSSFTNGILEFVAGDVFNNSLVMNGVTGHFEFDVNHDAVNEVMMYGDSTVFEKKVRVKTMSDSLPTTILGQANNKELRNIVPGQGLTLSNDTLYASGNGIPYDSTVVPSTKLLALNATQDTFTDIKGDFYDYDSVLGTSYTLKNTRVQNDTLVTHRGSYAHGRRSQTYNKTIAAGLNDTLNINTSVSVHDFEQTGGTYTHTIGPEEHYLVPGTVGTLKIFAASANVSLSATVAGDSYIGLYKNGFSTGCYAEFSLHADDVKENVSISCIISDVEDGDTFDLRLGNDEAGSQTYTLYYSTLTLYHIKNKVIPGF